MEIRCVEKFAFQNLAKDAGIDAYSSPTGTSSYKSMKTKIPFVARKTNTANEFGSRLDTIADLTLVAACMIRTEKHKWKSERK